MATNGIKEIKINNTNYLIEPTVYTTTKESAATATYTADLTNFQLFNGVVVTVRFATTNNANATLNINGTGAKPIYYNGAKLTASKLPALHLYPLVYDTSVDTDGGWRLVGDLNTDTDTAVIQANTTTDRWRKVLLTGGDTYTGKTTNIGDAITAGVYRSRYVAVQPSSGTLYATTLDTTGLSSSGDITVGNNLKVQTTGNPGYYIDTTVSSVARKLSLHVGTTSGDMGLCDDGSGGWIIKKDTNGKIYVNGVEFPSDAKLTDRYHKTGSWNGLTYTASAVNSADEFKFTIPTGTTATTVAAGNHNHDTVYSAIHQTTWSWASDGTQPLSKYVTFDANIAAGNAANAPDAGWYNGFVSSHGNYLGSFILNKHRTANWYVGWEQYPKDSSTNYTEPTWYLLAHSGNVETGANNGQIKIAGVNVSVKGLAALAYKETLAWNEITQTGADNLPEGTSNWTDNTEILTSYASNSGFADTNAKGKVYRRDAIAAWNYINSKAASIYAPLASPTFTGTPKSVTPTSSSDATMIATKGYVDNSFAANDAMIYKGVLNGASSNTNGGTLITTTGNKQGHTYKVGTAGYIMGEYCETGDMIICVTDCDAATTSNYSTVKANWTFVQTNLTNAVITDATGGENGYLAKFSAKSTLTKGPKIGTSTTTWLNEKGEWSTPTAANVGASASDHTHGNITNGGGMTATGVALANGDTLLFVDSSDTNKLIKQTSIAFDGSTTTQALSKKGSWESTVNVNIAADDTSSTDNYPIVYAAGKVATTTAQNSGLKKTTTKLYFQPSTGTLTATKFSGALSGNASSASKVSATLVTNKKIYFLGTETAITSTAANVSLEGDTGVYMTTTAGELSAVRHSYNVNGTEKAYTTYNTTDDSIDFIFI